MIVDPAIAQPQPLPTMGVRSASDIVDHLDKVLAAQPPEVQAAVDHAHGIMGLQSPVNAAAGAAGSPIAASVAPPAPDIPQPIDVASGGASPIVAAGSPTDAQPLPTPKPSAIASPVTNDPASGLAITPSVPKTVTPSAVAPIQNPHMENLERMTKEGTGTNKIHNPFLRGLATVGDAVGSGLFPEFTRYIPGFTAHHQQLMGEEENQLGQERAQAKSDADLSQQAASTKLTEAQVPHVEAETAALGNPKDEFALFHQQNPKGTVTDFVKQQEEGKNPTSPYQIWHKEPANAGKGYMEFLKEEAGTKPPANELELYVKTHPDEVNPLAGYEHEKQNITSKPLTKQTADTLNANYNTLAKQYKGIPTDQFHEGMTSAEATQIKAAMLGAIAGTQKGQNITINQAKADNASKNAMDKETSGEFKTLRKGLITDFGTADKQRQAAETAKRELESGPVGQNIGTIKTIVAAAGGQGSGVRVTQAELNSLASHLGPWETFDNFLSSVEGKGKFAQPTKDQINKVLDGIIQTASDKEGLLNDTIDKMGDAANVKELRGLDKEYRHKVAAPTESPARPKGVPEDAKWNAQKRTWEK